MHKVHANDGNGSVAAYLVAVLAEVVSLLPEDRQVQLVNALRTDAGVALVQMVHEHPAPLEAKHAKVALVDEPVVVCR